MNQSQNKYDDDAVTNPLVKSEATRAKPYRWYGSLPWYGFTVPGFGAVPECQPLDAMTAKEREDKKREFEWLLYYSGLKPSLGISI